MILISFRSKLTPAAGDDYAEAADQMLAYAQDMPGFIAIKSYRADDGERLTLVWWRDAVSLADWRQHPQHVEVKRTGREKWYEYYKMEVAEVVSTSDFMRPGSPPATGAAS